MICEVLPTDDGGLLFLCGRGLRAPRKRCAFCSQRATVQCDGDRCIRPLCDAHRWEARPAFGDRNVSLDFCPICEAKLFAGAKLPVQIGLFA